MNSELQQQLRNLALKRTIPFCYSCYQRAPAGVCKSCHSDDLMRLLPGHGCDYGLDWAIAAILREELTPVDIEEAFEDSMRSCYSEEVHVGWMSFDAVSVMKEMDPISWALAMSEWLEEEQSMNSLVMVEDRYYVISELKALL
nr:hypothetical protein HAGR004_12020 [Bdellovibrio sp. HAGR004]